MKKMRPTRPYECWCSVINIRKQSAIFEVFLALSVHEMYPQKTAFGFAVSFEAMRLGDTEMAEHQDR
jgi:hypothetical protein